MKKIRPAPADLQKSLITKKMLFCVWDDEGYTTLLIIKFSCKKVPLVLITQWSAMEGILTIFITLLGI